VDLDDVAGIQEAWAELHGAPRKAVVPVNDYDRFLIEELKAQAQSVQPPASATLQPVPR
jgi:hypothetical protein